MERIMIIGCPGSGKTTLARALAGKLDLPLVHLDVLGWRGEWEKVPRDEFDALLRAEVAKPRWIIDGNYARTIPMRLERCDTVIYLDFPRTVSTFGVLKRVITNRGKSRPDMGGDCPERFDPEFIKYAWNFNRENRAELHALLDGAAHARKVVLRSRRAVDEFLASL